MALIFGLPHTDNLLCSNVVCPDKANVILHMKDKTEQFYCDVHFPMEMVGHPNVDHVEKLRQSGERNNKPVPAPPADEDEA